MSSGTRFTKATAKFLIALFALSCVARAHFWRPHRHKPNSPTSHAPLYPDGAYHLDKYLVPDGVTLESNGFEKTIHIRFGNSRNQRLGFSTASKEDGKLVAGDIDRDGDIDLIWLGITSKSAVVLINQGEGDFAEAGDNAPYSSELDDLFNLGDPSDKRLVKHRRKTSTLTSSTFSDIAPSIASERSVPTVRRFPVCSVARNVDQLTFLASDPKRGPPSILS